jgi:hypothetical protein
LATSAIWPPRGEPLPCGPRTASLPASADLLIFVAVGGALTSLLCDPAFFPSSIPVQHAAIAPVVCSVFSPRFRRRPVRGFRWPLLDALLKCGLGSWGSCLATGLATVGRCPTTDAQPGASQCPITGLLLPDSY